MSTFAPYKFIKRRHHQYVLAAIFLGFFAQINAQTPVPKKHRFKDSVFFSYKNDTFSYTIVRNEPEKTANFSLIINPFYFELYGLNSNLGYDASIKYEPNSKFSFEAGYRGAYYESVEKENIGDGGSFGGPAVGMSNLKDFHIDGEYEFANILDTNVENVFIGRYNSNNLTQKMTAKYLVQYGLRVGFQYFETYISGDQIPFSGYYINDPSKTIVSFGSGPVGTMMQENIIDIGASATSTHDLLIHNDKLGNSKVGSKTYLYGDILYAPAIAYTNVIMKNYGNISGLEYTDFNVNSGIAKSRFGLRVGFDYFDLSTVGPSFGLEAGFRPGPGFGSGFYVMGKFGFALNAKIFKSEK